MTALDAAQAQVEAGGDTARPGFYRVLADTELFVLLSREAEAEVVTPRVFDLDDGPMVLAFDSEERLAMLDSGPVPYACLPGRVLAPLLAGQGLALGLNLGCGVASEMVLPVAALQWLADMLTPNVTLAGPGAALQAPGPADVALARHLFATAPAAWAGQAQAARLYGRGAGLALLVAGAAPEVQGALAVSLAEMFRFADMDGRPVDVGFAEVLPETGVLLPWPEAVAGTVGEDANSGTPPTGPGMDPAKPPYLR